MAYGIHHNDVVLFLFRILRAALTKAPKHSKKAQRKAGL